MIRRPPGPRRSGLLPQWTGKDYTDFPIGRVLFDSMEEVFLVNSYRGIVYSTGLKKMILTEFNQPLAANERRYPTRQRTIISIRMKC